MEYNVEVCDLKHKTQEDKIEVLTDDVSVLKRDMSDIKAISLARSKEIENICGSLKEQALRMDKLIDQNRALLVSVLLVFVGMAVWFLQYSVTH